MCGILGISNFSGSESAFSDSLESLNHRGPDNIASESYQVNGHHFLGHTRLSILDLSSAANQPMRSKSGRYSIIFNGEIYNYRKLRSQLKNSHSLEFRTESDTELILEGFEILGTDIVTHLHGMFAFAIFDHENGTHFLFRDRIGIKPLYYSVTEGGIVYGSELKALIPFIDTSDINMAAIHHFLHLGYIPSPLSIYSNVNKMPAGHFAVIENGKIIIERYWDANEFYASKIVIHDNPVKTIESLVEQSVESRLLSDVPVGTFLSGGTDSSLVTALANKIYGKPLPAFHINFENAVVDESKYAQEIARECKADYMEFQVKESHALEIVEEVLDSFDEPFSDASAIPTNIISEIASREVKVCLSGDGGDELFFGYGMYDWAGRLSNPVNKLASPGIKLLLNMSGSDRNRRAAWLFDNNMGNVSSHIFSQEQYLFSQAEIIRNFNFQDDPYFKEMKFPSDRNMVENQSFFDLKYYLPDDLLVKVDRSSMAHSLEVRVPLLDHHLVEFVLNLDFKTRKGSSGRKGILKDMLKKILPAELVERPKWGFSPPLVRWMRTEFRNMVDKYLDKEIIEKHGIVNPEFASKLLKRFYEKGEDRWYNRIWSLMILHRWLEINNE